MSLPLSPQGKECEFYWRLPQAGLSRELNRSHAAFVMSPKVTTCHLHLLSDPCPQRGCKSPFPHLLLGRGRIPAGGSQASSPCLRSPLAASLAEWPAPSHSCFLLLGFFTGGCWKQQLLESGLCISHETQIEDVAQCAQHTESRGRNHFVLVNDASL